jgi:hypothetical protein
MMHEGEVFTRPTPCGFDPEWLDHLGSLFWQNLFLCHLCYSLSVLAGHHSSVRLGPLLEKNTDTHEKK